MLGKCSVTERGVLLLFFFFQSRRRHAISSTVWGAGSFKKEPDRGRRAPRLHLGLPDRYLPHDRHEAQLAACGLDGLGIEQSIRAALERLGPADIASA